MHAIHCLQHPFTYGENNWDLSIWLCTIIHLSTLVFIGFGDLVGVAAFEMEYGHWVEEQNRLTCELRTALQAHVSDFELRILVESSMSHYDNLFRMKTIAAKSDVFYLMSGMWKTPAERFFLWIGGFRPSELLKVMHCLVKVC